MKIKQFLHEATQSLHSVGVSTARLDALVLLADELGHDKAWPLGHPEATLTTTQQKHLNQALAKRESHVPLAYIRGKQEFYGRIFTVNPAVLIPRPETEMLVELCLQLPLAAEDIVLDAGTGSGAIAITLKREMPTLTICATDINAAALAVAKKNAKRLGAKITFKKSDLLGKMPMWPANCIVANLPYVDRKWHRSPEIAAEPEIALFAEDGGLALIKKLIRQSQTKLAPAGYLLLEADPRQHKEIIQFARQHGFSKKSIHDFALVFQKLASFPDTLPA